MRSTALAALAWVLCACTASDQLIVVHDDASAADGPAPLAGSGGTTSTGGATAGTGGHGGAGAAPDAAETSDAPLIDPTADASMADRPPRSDAPVSGDGPEALTCAELPACAPGTECLCCPVGLKIAHCTCSIACLTDEECPASAPHCNSKRVQGIPVTKGFCTSPSFLCVQ